MTASIWWGIMSGVWCLGLAFDASRRRWLAAAFDVFGVAMCLSIAAWGS